jgi:F-type H+-transporting ATPase subunit delta
MDKNLLKVLLTSVAGRYSRAIFEEARRKSVMENVKEDFKKIDILRKENPSLWNGMSNKALNLQQISDLWHQVGEKLGLCALVKEFIIFLCQVKRINLWPSVFQIYQFLEEDQQNQRRIFVKSSSSLNSVDRQNIIQALKKFWKSELILSFSVCPSLKAGLVIQSNNLQLDMSLNSYTSALSRLLRKG